MAKILKSMIKIYKPDGIDWMNFVVTRRNPYTFHHIKEKHNGGDDSIQNGAILTRMAHDLLHILEFACPNAYDDLQNIFYRINSSLKQVDEDTYEEIDDILYKVFVGEKYDIDDNIDLSNYANFYYHHGKKVKQKIK